MAFANMISRSLIQSVQKSMTDILDKEIFAEEAKTENVETPQPESEKPSNAVETYMNCRVTGIRDRILVIEQDESELKIDKNQINLEGYVPEIGDNVWIDVETLEDGSVKYKKVYPDPDDKDEVIGIVTVLDEEGGLVDDRYVFNKRIFEEGFRVNVGSSVKCTIIGTETEYNAKDYTFRCVKIKLEGSHQTGRNSKKHKEKYSQEDKVKKDVKLQCNTCTFKFQKVGEEKTGTFTLENVGDKSQKLKKILFKNIDERENFQLALVDPFVPVDIEPKDVFHVKISAVTTTNETHATKIVFHLDNYVLCGTVYIHNSDPELETVKNKYYTETLLQDKGDVIPGEKPCRGPKFTANPILPHLIPDRIKEIVLQSGSYEKILGELTESFYEIGDPLSYENFESKLGNLLHLEEVELYHQMRQYDQDKARLTREHGFLALVVEGLTERRPSLVIGDRVILSFPKSPNTKHEGWIHQVRQDTILLRFSQAFHNEYNAELVRLVFEFSRANFKKQHEAIKRIYSKVTQNFLFPHEAPMKHALHNITLNDAEEMIFDGFERKVEWHNKDLNKYQKMAVINVLRGESRPLPYIIYGPPGTGKTITLVEIIQHIVTLDKDSHILVATPSNSSADLITERLLESDAKLKEIFIRVVGHNLVERDTIPEHLKKYCATLELAKDGTVLEKNDRNADGILLRINVGPLMKKQIIIGTCACIGNLMTQKFPVNHFTHVIIDEAGQLIEPEAMIPISLVKNQGQVILAGDPKQLGPIVFSRYARDLGLTQSYLDRLLMELPYTEKEDGFNQKLVTKLIDNYRSIPSILRGYNEIFYDGALQNRIQEDDPKCIEFANLKKAQPLLREMSDYYFEKKSGMNGIHFVPIDGINEHESSSPSWFNTNEKNAVVNTYIKLLLHCKFEPHDIGIISPYKLQCKKILDELKEKKLKALPKVGSVEEFQGQEKTVILISTVRTCASKLNQDKKFSLGFVREPKRMNVVISRAKSLLIIFGCPEILQTDDNWLQLINLAIQYKTYHGIPKANH